jgi:hypothetical protein
MSKVPYFEFQGVKYGIGTILKVPRTLDLRWRSKEQIMKEAEFVGGGCFEFLNHTGSIFLCQNRGLSGPYEEYIEIIKPVYYQEPEGLKPQNIFLSTGSGSWDAHNDICVGLIWYIIIMVVGVLFKARLIIWVLATWYFFAWKSKK